MDHDRSRGHLAEARPAVQPNDLYNTHLRLIFYDEPIFGHYQERFDRIFAEPRYTDLAANLAYFSQLYTAILRQTPDVGTERGSAPRFYQRYYDTIAAREGERRRKARQAVGRCRPATLNTMQPLLISHLSIVSSIGAGRAATLSSLRSGTSGLRPCQFETVDLPTYVGEIDALADFKLPEALAAFDCRNNRLAEMALAPGRIRGRGGRCSGALRRAADRPVPRHQHLGNPAGRTGLPGTRRGDGELPAGFDYQRTQNTASLAGYVRQRLGHRRPVIRRLVRLRIDCQGVRQCRAHDRGGTVRCRHRRRRRHTVPDHAVRLPCAGSERAGPCRPFDAARDGISIGEAAGFALLEQPQADDRLATQSCCSASARATMRITCRRRIPTASAHGWRWNARWPRPAWRRATSTTSTCMARRRRVGDAAEDLAVIGAVRQRHAVQLHQGAHRAHAWRRRHRRGDHQRAGDSTQGCCPAARIPKRSIRPSAAAINWRASRRGSTPCSATRSASAAATAA